MKKVKQNNPKGITLIALVITIILLLILAGVSIAMLTGENGILTKATNTKEDTQKVGTKEKLELAVAGYQIEKNTGNIDMVEYLKDTEKSGLEGIEIVSENGENIIGKYEGYTFIIDEKGKINIGHNLVKNGLLEEKNNTNFSDMQYNEQGKYLTMQSNNRKIHIVPDEYIEIDSSKEYFQSITAKANNTDSKIYIGLQEYDVDKRSINPFNYMYIDGSLTYLEQDLNNGDTDVYLNDVSGFKKENTEIYQRGFIFWNYKDSKGYQYPELTYSRNQYPSNGNNIFEESGIESENNTIHLNEPWKYGKIEKGTKLSQRNSGATYNYGLLYGKNLSTNWKNYRNKISGVIDTGAYSFIKFRPGTKYVRPMIIFNYNQTIDTTIDVKDIIFMEV